MPQVRKMTLEQITTAERNEQRDKPKGKRGRPKGSKNKPKAPIMETTSAQRGKYTFKASGCGCTMTSDVYGSGMFCTHKNSMTLITR